MTDTTTGADAHRVGSPSRRWLAVLGVVVLACIGVRGWLALRPGYPAAIDAAYYPIQARSLLEHGRLVYPDMPLKFAIDAGLGMLLRIIRGTDLDSALLLASRLTDAVLPALIAVPIFLLGRSWAGEARNRLVTSLAIAAATLPAVLSGPVVRMVLDFQKNSLGLVWFAGAVWACHVALRSTGGDAGRVTLGGLVRRWTPLGVMLLLSALTHIGALGATLVAVFGAMGVFFAFRAGWSPRRWALIVIGGGVLACVVGLGVWLAAPNKAAALLKAPLAMFDRSGGMSGGPPGLGGPRGMNGGNGSIAMALLMASRWAVVYAVVAWALIALWWHRRRVGLADAATVLGVSAAALILAFPLLSGDYAMRLTLMTPAAASMLLAFIFATRARFGGFAWPAALVGAASLATLAMGLGLINTPGPQGGPGGPPGMMAGGPRGPRGGPGGPPGGGPGGMGGPRMMMGPGMGGSLPDGADEELNAVGEIVRASPRPLIIARHGLEFWAEYFTKVSSRQRSPDNAVGRFDTAFQLVETRGPMGGRGGLDGPGGPPERRAGGPPRDDDPLDAELDDLFDDGPGGLGPPPGMGRPGGGPGGGPGGQDPMGPLGPPRDGELVYSGQHYRLYRLSRIPDSRLGERNGRR